MTEGKLKFGINIEKIWKGSWSLGICFSHQFDGETYLYINLFKWTITIGKIYVYESEERNGEN